MEIAGKKTIGTSDLCSAVKAGMRKSSKCTQGTKETPLERHKSNRKSTEDQSDGHLKQMKIQFILEKFFGIFFPFFGKRKLGPILLFGVKKTFVNVSSHLLEYDFIEFYHAFIYICVLVTRRNLS